MAKLLLLLVVVSSQFAFAKDSGGGGGSGGGMRMVSLGVQKGSILEMGTETVDDFKDLKGAFIGMDYSNPKNPKFGFRVALGFLQGDGGSTTTWNQTTATEMTLTDTYVDVNLLLYLFKSQVGLWISPGATFGSLTMESQVSKETKFHQGWNAGAGLDFMIMDVFGIRAGYVYQYVYSDEIGKMDDRRMTYNNSRVFGALIFEPF